MIRTPLRVEMVQAVGAGAVEIVAEATLADAIAAVGALPEIRGESIRRERDCLPSGDHAG